MNPLEKIRQSLSGDIDRLNACIADALGSDNALMNSVIDGYLKSKGKQIRPILVILAARMFGHVTDSVIAAAASVEMLHNASLIHDDVVDETKTRRHRPTLNAIWDNHIAVLSGDFFVSSALLQAISTGNIAIVSALARLGRLLSLGEIDQISNARAHRLDEQAYMDVISQKTASLFVACVEMGAYAAGVTDPKRVEPLCRFAELLGRAFQIRDDIFDYYDDPVIGKPTGNDLREGKMTLPLIHTLCDTSLPGRDEVLAIAEKEELDTADIDRLVAYARDGGGIDYAYSVMAAMRDEALTILAESCPAGTSADAFAELFDFIIARTY